MTVAVGDVLYRRQRRGRWHVDEIDRTPDFSCNARVPGEKTGPLRALLRRDWDADWRAWFPIDELHQLGFRKVTDG